MKKALLFLVLSVSLFARGFGGGPHFSPPPHQPPRIIAPAPVVVAPRVVVTGGGYVYGGVYGGYYGPGFGLYGAYPYWYPGYGWISAPEPKACQKEKLKGDDGKKHEVLACRQGDGTIKIFSADGSVK
jgi:hypothetical protein